MTNKIVKRSLSNPSYIKQGSGYLSKSWRCSIEEVKEARKKAKEVLQIDKDAEIANYVGELESVLVGKETDHTTGKETVTFECKNHFLQRK